MTFLWGMVFYQCNNMQFTLKINNFLRNAGAFFLWERGEGWEEGAWGGLNQPEIRMGEASPGAPLNWRRPLERIAFVLLFQFSSRRLKRFLPAQLSVL